MAESVSIVLPYLDNWHLTHQRLAELYRHAPDCEIVLVDDCSQEPESITGAQWWVKTFDNIRYFRNEENLGFSKSNNFGALKAQGNILIFTQNDVQIGGNFLKPALEYLRQANTVVCGRIVNQPAHWNEFEIDGEKFFLPYMEGWLVALWRSDFEKIGGWDERYSPIDYEDIDLSTSALYNNYDLVELNLRFLRHQFGQTTNKTYGVQGRRKITERNRRLFIEKWGAGLLEVRRKVVAHVS